MVYFKEFDTSPNCNFFLKRPLYHSLLNQRNIYLQTETSSFYDNVKVLCQDNVNRKKTFDLKNKAICHYCFEQSNLLITTGTHNTLAYHHE